eukprot:4605239-Prymnesium_polylepis.3
MARSGSILPPELTRIKCRDGSPPRESSPPAVSRDGSREGSLEGGQAYVDAWSKSATSLLRGIGDIPRGIGDFPSPTGAQDIAPLCEEYDAATSRFTGFLIDLDGTTYEPGGLIPGARRMLRSWESNRGRCTRAGPWSRTAAFAHVLTH